MRREKIVDMKGGRDDGKKFKITEMSAEKAEWWAFRVLQAAMSADVEIDLQAPLAELAGQGLRALARINQADAKPLLAEMMECVEVVIPAGGTRKLMDGDIEDVKTRLLLRKDVMELHMGFSIGGDE